MEECVAIARRVAERIGTELSIPVYLYEEAALLEERRNLAHCRKGEYEALCEKLGKPEWKPDFGPDRFDESVARSGVTNVGARQFLVAYNINLNTRLRGIAQDIALDIREAGRAKRDENGEIVRDAQGKAIKVPGILKACKCVGWEIPEYDRAQISMNLVNTSITRPHEAFEECRKQANRRGVRVTGSELVGLIPEADMLLAGRHFLETANQSPGVPRRQLIETAIQSLGLREISPFDPKEKIIEYQAGLVDGELVSMTNREFADLLSTDAPAPGGGSVAALCAAQAAALGAMVANLTVGRKGHEEVQDRVKEIAVACQGHKDFFLSAVDEDTDAFNRVMDCFRMPRKTEEQKKTRGLAVAEATRGATRIPLTVLERASEMLGLVTEIAEIGNQNSLSDAGVGSLVGMAGAEGAFYNVLINLDALGELDQSADPEFAATTRKRALAAMETCEQRAQATRKLVRAKLE
jgi:glutamate formiminotransferase/formiminotetrahydrofolate cyclodeaminase